MNATEKVVLRELIDRIRKDGRTILLIEHDVAEARGRQDLLGLPRLSERLHAG